MLSVLQVITDDDLRGAQVFARDLADGLTDLGHRVRTVGLSHGSAGGLDVEVLGPKRIHATTLVRLRRLAASSDVVIAHGSTTLPVCAIASLGAQVPFVYRQISDSLFWANSPGRRARVRWGLSRAARVVALWDGAANTLTEHFGVPSHRIDRIANGVPAEGFPFVPDREKREMRQVLDVRPDLPVVAYVGALVEEKGVDMIVDAMAGLPEMTLLIAGAGPERRRLEQRAAVHGRRAKFLGALDRPQIAYAAADVVVLPSRGGDSMPATLIEAGLTGRPVVSTPIGGIPEIVRHGVTGFVVPPDDVGALGAAVDKVLADETLRTTMSSAARAHCVKRYTIQAIAREWSTTVTRTVTEMSGRQRYGGA